jgi:uncharacterized membrane protein
LATVQEYASIFQVGSLVSAGVIATIFGILSLIVFLFMLYWRSGNRIKYYTIGEFAPRDEFDAVVADDHRAKADYSFSYSATYEYEYDDT